MSTLVVLPYTFGEQVVVHLENLNNDRVVDAQVVVVYLIRKIFVVTT
jgi:hypothetical protein